MGWSISYQPRERLLSPTLPEALEAANGCCERQVTSLWCSHWQVVLTKEIALHSCSSVQP